MVHIPLPAVADLTPETAGLELGTDFVDSGLGADFTLCGTSMGMSWVWDLEGVTLLGHLAASLGPSLACTDDCMGDEVLGLMVEATCGKLLGSATGHLSCALGKYFLSTRKSTSCSSPPLAVWWSRTFCT